MVRILALTALFSAAAVYEAMHVSAILAQAVWIHLRTGLWMLQYHSIPRTGLFSQFPTLPWNDSSWLFDAWLGAAYRATGLRAIPILLICLKVALAVVTFLLARSARASFWLAVVLSAVAQFVIVGLQPLPYACSILLFSVELILLVESRKTGWTRSLYGMPALFLLWANVDIQFVLGLVLLALYLIAITLEQLIRNTGKAWISPQVQQVDLRSAGIVGLASLAATFATPYTIHLLPHAFAALYGHASFEYFSEMTSMSFRHPQEFLLMLLVMGAFLALGRRRSLDLFSLFVLLASSAIAFRVQRDGWLVVLPAIVIVPGAFSPGQGARTMGSRGQKLCSAGLTGLVIICCSILLPNQSALTNKIDEAYPVKACNYIRDHGLPRPLFNDYPWGSFITWYLPEYPVAVDNRVEFYGNQSLESYFGVIGGKQALETDGRVSPSGTLLLARESAMAKALLNLPVLTAKYRLVYSDDLADVFVGTPASE